MDVASAWRPYVSPAARTRHVASPDVRPLLGGDDPSAAYEEQLLVQPGDLLVAGTHGLFDM
eukprot:187142-Chlamydomonas_euryale.AAC.1